MVVVIIGPNIIILLIEKMWKLKFGGDIAKEPYLFSTNNFHGRQIWEYDPDAGSPEERAEVEEARRHFYQNRFKVKACSDHLWRFQVTRQIAFTCFIDGK